MPLYCRRATTPNDLEKCLAIRDTVFVKEQGVEPSIERDGLDESSFHYIGEIDGKAIAAARVRMQDDRFKFQRVAVLKEARGRGIGESLMRFMMDELANGPDAAGRHFFLSSQTYAVPFYEKLGFWVCSDEYEDAGIPHRDMRADIVRGQAAGGRR